MGQRDNKRCALVEHFFPSPFDIPREKLPNFGGCLKQCRKLANLFEIFPQLKILNPEQGLLHLTTYCHRRTNEAIEECSMLNVTHGYARETKLRMENCAVASDYLSH